MYLKLISVFISTFARSDRFSCTLILQTGTDVDHLIPVLYHVFTPLEHTFFVVSELYVNGA